MDVLWSTEGWTTPGEVHEQLARTRPLAYNTVLTIMVRLWKKDRVDRQRDGRAYAYRPVLSREQWAANRIGDVLGEVEDRPAVLSRMIDQMTSSDRDQLRRLLADPTNRKGR